MTVRRTTLAGTTWEFRNLVDLMAKATPLRSGDVLAGCAAGSAAERVAAQVVLADLPLTTFLDEQVVGYEEDDVTRLILDTHDPVAFAPVAHLTVGGFRDWLLDRAAAGDEAAISGLARGLTPEMVAAVSKLMRNADLVAVGRRARVVTGLRSTIGLPGTPGQPAAAQPPHRRPDRRHRVAARRAAPRQRRRGGRHQPRHRLPRGHHPAAPPARRRHQPLRDPHPVLRARPRHDHAARAGGRAPRSTWSSSPWPAPSRPTGASGSPSTCSPRPRPAPRRWAAARSGATSRTSRPGRARPCRPTPTAASTGCRSTSRRSSAGPTASPATSTRCWSTPWSGFIGPEYLYDGKQVIRAGLEDHFCGKLLGLPMGVDVCYTNHTDVDGDDTDTLTLLLGAAGCSFVIAVPGSDDVMLHYQSLSFQDVLTARQVLGLRPAPEFEDWLERMGLMDDDGHVLSCPPTPPAPAPCSPRPAREHALETAGAAPSADPWQVLRRPTRARVALGRAGDALPTARELEFRAAHAAAKDAVHTPFDPALVRAGLGGPRGPRGALRRRRTGPRTCSAPTWAAGWPRAPSCRASAPTSPSSSRTGSRRSRSTATPRRPCSPCSSASTAGTSPPWCSPRRRGSRSATTSGTGSGRGRVVVLVGERPGLSSADSLGRLPHVGPAARPGGLRAQLRVQRPAAARPVLRPGGRHGGGPARGRPRARRLRGGAQGRGPAP